MNSRSIQTLTTLFFLFFAIQSHGQRFATSHRGDFPFKVSLGFNIVDDTFKNADNFETSSELNIVPFPSRISVEGILYEYLSWEGAFSYNKYEAGHLYNGGQIMEDWDYYSYDANIKFYFGDFLNSPEFFEPYINAGLCHNIIHDKSNAKMALGGGFNIWPFENNYDYRLRNRIINRLGFFFQLQGKVAFENTLSETGEKHIQAAFGAIYKFR